MASSNPQDRVLIAQIAAAERWGRETDRSAATAPAREGRRAKFAKQIDPEGVLDPAERERRVDSLVHAHMLRMSRLARISRLKARKLTAEADAAETELSALGGGPDAAA